MIFFENTIQDAEFKIEETPIDYEQAIILMEKRVEQIIQGTSDELIWILEHPSIYTLGTSAKEGDILDPLVPHVHTKRGGQVTYHGPGQQIVYVMLKMKRFENDLKKYLNFLKESVSKPLIRIGIDVIQNESTVGLWANHPLKGRCKIAFIGIRIRKGISFHGISININPDLNAFSKIVPCGIREEKVTSVADIVSFIRNY